MDSVQNAVSETDAGSSKPVLATPRPLTQRIYLWAHLWSFKAFVNVAFGILRYFNIREFGALKPTYTKVYNVPAGLSNDIWVPKDYKSGTTLPLYIDVHGGGFAIGDPGHDAIWCDYLANKHGICVVSVNYRKAPRFPFPHQHRDVAEVVEQVVNDPDLPVDKSKIAMGGFSAGGNLSLTSNLCKELEGKIKGLLLFYPSCDISGKYKGQFRTAPDGSPDVLTKTSEMFTYGYVPVGQDMSDPYLSPAYGDRSKLPPKMFFIGAEFDVLCREAEKTAEIYAAAEGAAVDTTDPNAWTAGGIRWLRVLDAQHGFNAIPKKGVWEEKRQKITNEVFEEAVKWLKEEVYN